MKRYKRWLTAGLGITIVGVLAGCGTAGNIPSVQVSNSTSIAPQSTSNSTNNASQQLANGTKKTSIAEHPGSGQQSGTKSATAGYYQGLKTVTYSSAEMQKIRQISQQQGITAYVPDKMGGPSGYYVPGRAARGSSHSITIPFEDMSFYEAPSWQDLKQDLSPQKGAVALFKGGDYTLIGNKPGQWYTLKYSDGARSDIFVVQEGNTCVGIVPNPAKSTIPSLVQAVAQTLRPIS